MMLTSDFLIIGSGIAGLAFAIKAANEFPDKKITILTKSDGLESNTRYAQGGIAGVLNHKEDHFTSHFLDTLKAGDYLNNPDIVEMVVKEAPERIYEIVQWGVSFDQDHEGNFNLGLEGGHSTKRILHHKDITGFEIQKTLLNKVKSLTNIEIIIHAFAKDLILEQEQCIGVHFIDIESLKEKKIIASKVLLATGGIGQAYLTTTNPCIATGDGIAMAYRAGAVIENMEFIQFHPTVLFHSKENPSFLISEAVRGEGAILVNHEGKDFMKNYSPLGSLAPRDIVARGIETEIKISGKDFVYLDCRPIDPQKLLNHFPNIYQKCIQLGLDPRKDFIPVAPAVHYVCGGIKTDRWAQTSINNLYALGECASTGLHGANRLASNSLLEALVFAHQAYIHIVSQSREITVTNSTNNTWNVLKIDKENNKTDLIQLKHQLKSLLTKHAGIIRTYDSLRQAEKNLTTLEGTINSLNNSSIEYLEIKNLNTIARLIIKASLERKENKGLYYNSDLEKKLEVDSWKI